MIYFDHNATTPIDPRVVDAMLPYLHSHYGNPSSLHRIGRIARSAIDTAREQLAVLIDAAPTQIIFTSGGTEANALAINSARGRRLLVSEVEHPSLMENAQLHQDVCLGFERLPVNCDGKLLDNVTLQNGDFVSVMLANNETGALQDVAAIAAKAAEIADVVVHTDAVQALGKIPVSFRQLGVDLMSVSSHKIYGPKGCGALVSVDDSSLYPLQVGGDQEFGLRAGTENVAAIVGFGKAAELARIELEQRILHLRALRECLLQGLRAIPGVVIFAERIARLPNTVQFGIPGINGEMLLMQLDQRQIAVSSGSACKVGSEQISPVLMAMGVEPSLAKAAIRVSLGKDNQLAEIDQFVAVLKTLLERN